MKKRILSCLMALALCLTLLPTAALAEGTAENVAEVTISDGTTTQHTDIVAAFTAAQEAASATVKLLKKSVVDKRTALIFALVLLGSIFLSVSPVWFVLLAALSGIALKALEGRKTK